MCFVAWLASYPGGKHLRAPDSRWGRPRRGWWAAERANGKRLRKCSHRGTTSQHRDSPETPNRSENDKDMEVLLKSMCLKGSRHYRYFLKPLLFAFFSKFTITMYKTCNTLKCNYEGIAVRVRKCMCKYNSSDIRIRKDVSV